MCPLLELGADPKAVHYDGHLLLHHGVIDASGLELVEALVTCGAPVDGENSEGHAALHTAARRTSDPDVIAALLRAGASHLRDTGGRRRLLIEASVNPSTPLRRSVVRAVMAAHKAVKSA